MALYKENSYRYATSKLRFYYQVRYISVPRMHKGIPIVYERKQYPWIPSAFQNTKTTVRTITRAHLRVFHGGCYGDGGRVRQQEVVLVHQLVPHEHRGPVLVAARTDHSIETLWTSSFGRFESVLVFHSNVIATEIELNLEADICSLKLSFYLASS